MNEKGRKRRLIAELADMGRLCRQSSHLMFEAEGETPELYRVTLRCNGIWQKGNDILPINQHQFELSLGPGFPAEPPDFVWQTPIFHPNILGQVVCLGDHWMPRNSIADLCEVLIEMVQYKHFNIYDPLNIYAAAWVYRELELQPERFPVDPSPTRDLEFNLKVGGGPS